jgi:hypothetical protein
MPLPTSKSGNACSSAFRATCSSSGVLHTQCTDSRPALARTLHMSCQSHCLCFVITCTQHVHAPSGPRLNPGRKATEDSLVVGRHPLHMGTPMRGLLLTPDVDEALRHACLLPAQRCILHALDMQCSTPKHPYPHQPAAATSVLPSSTRPQLRPASSAQSFMPDILYTSETSICCPTMHQGRSKPARKASIQP